MTLRLLFARSLVLLAALLSSPAAATDAAGGPTPGKPMDAKEAERLSLVLPFSLTHHLLQ